MADDPLRELEMILHQSKQLAGRLGASESQNEITRMHLMELRDAARDVYEKVGEHSDRIESVYGLLVEFYGVSGLNFGKREF